jgi:hypothetical protein
MTLAISVSPSECGPSSWAKWTLDRIRQVHALTASTAAFRRGLRSRPRFSHQLGTFRRWRRSRRRRRIWFPRRPVHVASLSGSRRQRRSGLHPLFRGRAATPVAKGDALAPPRRSTWSACSDQRRHELTALVPCVRRDWCRPRVLSAASWNAVPIPSWNSVPAVSARCSPHWTASSAW